MDPKSHKPIFADRVKITSEWNAGANVSKTFAKYGWVPPSVAAARQAQQTKEQQPESVESGHHD